MSNKFNNFPQSVTLSRQTSDHLQALMFNCLLTQAVKAIEFHDDGVNPQEYDEKNCYSDSHLQTLDHLQEVSTLLRFEIGIAIEKSIFDWLNADKSDRDSIEI